MNALKSKKIIKSNVNRPSRCAKRPRSVMSRMSYDYQENFDHEFRKYKVEIRLRRKAEIRAALESTD